jgi:hypothetical protein
LAYQRELFGSKSQYVEVLQGFSGGVFKAFALNHKVQSKIFVADVQSTNTVVQHAKHDKESSKATVAASGIET